ncbi:MAG: class I SAM-dependent methyltransferase [Candidatus Hodarchaeota archaeon]
MLFPEWVHYLRDCEREQIEVILKLIEGNNSRILEIGSGDGYMSYKLQEKGFNVIATDPNPRKPLFPMYQMNGEDLKFKDNMFDVVFSSNVLEHIVNLPKTFSEMKRVIKNDGMIIHTIPTVSCCILTYIINPIAYFRDIIKVISQKQHITLKQFNPLKYMKGKHGTSRSVFNSLVKWRRKVWKRIFKENDLEIKKIYRIPFFNSMHKVFPFRFMKFRKNIGRKLGSTDIYILKRCL